MSHAADDLLDPFPFSEGHVRAQQLLERLERQREVELRQLLERVANNRQSLGDIARLAKELGIRFNPVVVHAQD